MGPGLLKRRPVAVAAGSPVRADDLGALLRALEAAAFAGTWVWDVARDALVLDHGAAALVTGGARPEGSVLTIDAFLDCVHPEDRDWLRTCFRLKGLRGGTVERHYRIRWPTGEVRSLHGRGTIEVGPGGTVVGRGTISDLTDRAAEAAAPRGDTRLRLYDATIDHTLILRDAVRRLDGEPSVTLVDTLLLSLCEDAAGELEPGVMGRKH